MTGLAANLEQVRARIATAAARSGRDPASIRLVCASKTMPAEVVRAAVVAGATDFGENRVQEAIAKVDALADTPCRWHFIGQLQTNKVKFLANRFDLVHSVDRVSLALALDRHARGAGHVQAVLIQVNVAGEASKAGVAPSGLGELCRSVRPLPGLRLAGLMTVAPEAAGEAAIRDVFRTLRALRDRWVPGGELSMGMSGDFEPGVEEGATLVRVGRAIFGQRGVG